jgi:transposase
LSVELVRKSPKPVPEKVAKAWVEEWAKEGKEVDWQRLMPPRGFRVLPRRWVVERTFAWISDNRRMSKDYERLCAQPERRSSTGDEEAHGEAVSSWLGLSRADRPVKS